MTVICSAGPKAVATTLCGWLVMLRNGPHWLIRRLTLSPKTLAVTRSMAKSLLRSRARIAAVPAPASKKKGPLKLPAPSLMSVATCDVPLKKTVMMSRSPSLSRSARRLSPGTSVTL